MSIDVTSVSKPRKRPEGRLHALRPAQERPISVCQVAATTEGATWMVEQLRDLRNHFGCVPTAVIEGETGSLVDKCRSEGIPIHAHDFGFTALHDLLRLPGCILALARYFRSQRFDVVHTHLFHSMIVGRMAAWLADVPVRTSMVASPFHLEATTPRWIDRATCWMDTVLIGSCRYTVELYQDLGVKKDQVALVYYGADERKFSADDTDPAPIREEFGWPEDTPIVAMIAYFYPPLPQNGWIPPAVQGRAVKGHEYVIQAAPAILEKFPNAKILLVGNGWGEAGTAYMEQMQALVKELNLEESVIFTGYRADVNNILRAADVAIQASLCENLGGTIESLLMRCPTVATRVGGLVDTVVHEETGLLVEPRDPDSLAKAIVRLLRDPEYARQLATAGEAWVRERFTLRRTVEDLATLYEQRLFSKNRRKKGYRLHVSLFRLLVSIPLAAYLAGRLAIQEYSLHRQILSNMIMFAAKFRPRRWFR